MQCRTVSDALTHVGVPTRTKRALISVLALTFVGLALLLETLGAK
jgi:hypothetical protein